MTLSSSQVECHFRISLQERETANSLFVSTMWMCLRPERRAWDDLFSLKQYQVDVWDDFRCSLLSGSVCDYQHRVVLSREHSRVDE